MDEFKKTMRRRQILLVAGLLFACSGVLLSRSYIRQPVASEFSEGFIGGFQFGILLGLLSFLIFFLIRNVLAMRNPDRLRKLYIAETDERIQFIKQKSGSEGLNIITYGLAVGSAIAGNINETVFFTLLGACLFVVSVRGLLKVYCRIKY